MIAHHPILREKTPAPYVDPVTGVEHQPPVLHKLDCTCGAPGLAWYASEDRAWRSWERHLPAETAVAA